MLPHRSRPDRLMPVSSYRVRKGHRRLPDDVRVGVLRGIAIATAFSAFVVSTARFRKPSEPTWRIVGFYYGAGVAGGIIFGLLRPWRHTYPGKFVTAYLILFLIYGGGSTVFLPVINHNGERPIPLATLLAIWAVLCVVLAPIYVKLLGSSWSSSGTA